jgi:hypothetical protein
MEGLGDLGQGNADQGKIESIEKGHGKADAENPDLVFGNPARIQKLVHTGRGDHLTCSRHFLFPPNLRLKIVGMGDAPEIISTAG